MITGTIPPLQPVIWDIATDYKEAEERFYARDDIDHKVYIPDRQAVYGNPETGEIKTARDIGAEF